MTVGWKSVFSLRHRSDASLLSQIRIQLHTFKYLKLLKALLYSSLSFSIPISQLIFPSSHVEISTRAL